MLHIIVGNTGAGKTTYAQTLKKENDAVIFSIDEWNATLFLADKKTTDGLDWSLERIERSETMIQSLIVQLEASKIDTILDLGFSKFEHREKFRMFAKSKGFAFKLHFLDVPKAIRFKRILQRNKDKGATYAFDVSQEDFDFMETWFERPTASEMKNGITISV